MILFYREKGTGDFCCIDTTLVIDAAESIYEGRATCITDLPNSVNTTGISKSFLREACTRVRRSAVPKTWLEALVG